MSKRILIVNEQFAPSDEFIEEYINTKDALPNLLSNILSDFDADLDTKRLRLYEKYPYLEKLDDEESEITLNLLKEGKKTEANNYQVDLALEFLKAHPQFRPIISGVDTATGSFIKEILLSIRQAFLGEF